MTDCVCGRRHFRILIVDPFGEDATAFVIETGQRISVICSESESRPLHRLQEEVARVLRLKPTPALDVGWLTRWEAVPSRDGWGAGIEGAHLRYRIVYTFPPKHPSHATELGPQ